MHLFRKHNKFTPFDSNYKLKTLDEEIDFHRISNISFFEKDTRSIMVRKYLDAI
jgi:uncharacterized protein YijF (DUF1287 family)